MIQWGNEQVPSDVYNAAVEAGKKYGKDAEQQKEIANTLLGVGKIESGWRINASNTNGEASYGWLQFNRNGGFGSQFTIEQLTSSPQLEADVAAEHIARNLNSGVSLFDSLWPWWNTRTAGIALANVNGTQTSVGSGTNNPTPKPSSGNAITDIGRGIGASIAGNPVPSGASQGALTGALPNPLGGLDAVGKFFSDIENNSKRLGASAVAVVLVVGGLFIIGKGVTKRA